MKCCNVGSLLFSSSIIIRPKFQFVQCFDDQTQQHPPLACKNYLNITMRIINVSLTNATSELTLAKALILSSLSLNKSNWNHLNSMDQSEIHAFSSGLMCCVFELASTAAGVFDNTSFHYQDVCLCVCVCVCVCVCAQRSPVVLEWSCESGLLAFQLTIIEEGKQIKRSHRIKDTLVLFDSLFLLPNMRVMHNW